MTSKRQNVTIKINKPLDVREKKAGVSALPQVSDGRAKVGLRPFLKAQTVHKKDLERWQSDLFSGAYSVVNKDDKDALSSRMGELIVKDFEGLKLTYWEKKVVIALYCQIEKQGVSIDNPVLYLENRSDLYGEVLEKGGNGRYHGSERKQFDEAMESLQTHKKEVVFYKTITEDGKKKRQYCLMEGVLIPEAGYIIETGGKSLSNDEIRNKGKFAIKLHTVLLDGIIDNFRLIPKNIAGEIKKTGVKRVREEMEDFIYWLHSHTHDTREIRRRKDVLIQELKLEREYRKNKSRTINKLHETYKIAKETGYLKDYKINQKGKTGDILDIFYLNADKIYHTKEKKLPATPTPLRIGGKSAS